MKWRAALGAGAAAGGVAAALALGGSPAVGAGLGTTTTTTTTPPPTTTTTTIEPPTTQTIYMRGSQPGPNGDLRFEFEGGLGDRLIRGEDLRIVNETDPQGVGPHTFTLLVPKAIRNGTQSPPRKCFQSGICGKIAEWHQFNGRTGEVGKPVVRAGKPGWDRKGSLAKPGDSWFTQAQDDQISQVLSSGQNKLRFFCAIHPEMRGTIRIANAPVAGR